MSFQVFSWRQLWLLKWTECFVCCVYVYLQRGGVGEHGSDVCEESSSGRGTRVSGEHGKRAGRSCSQGRWKRARGGSTGGRSGYTAGHAGKKTHKHSPKDDTNTKFSSYVIYVSLWGVSHYGSWIHCEWCFMWCLKPTSTNTALSK